MQYSFCKKVKIDRIEAFFNRAVRMERVDVRGRGVKLQMKGGRDSSSLNYFEFEKILFRQVVDYQR